MKPRFPDGIPFVLGVATGLAALAFYYVATGGWSGAQIWVGGFHVHHFYVGIGVAFVSVPLWMKGFRFWSLFFLGLGSAVMLDGAIRTLYNVSGPYP